VPHDAQSSLITIDDLARTIRDVLGRWFGEPVLATPTQPAA
jgi:hypothetical protein